jgi:hypothetical protein
MPNSLQSYQDRQLEVQIQKAIELSLASAKPPATHEPGTTTAATKATVDSDPGCDEKTPEAGSASSSVAAAATTDLDLAIQMSEKALQQHKQKQEEEDETLQKVLALSMNEK